MDAMASPRKSYGDYSVGWICALPKEQTAATAMLDEKHADLPKLTNDANTYTLGSIGPHNVVIACLPKGQYGTNSAANVASFMIRTFPFIKIGLMVGIGGGVPPMVRLGDVVVSTPTGQYPGVVQWDFGKATEGGGFERIGALSNPPGSLLTALTKMETDYELTGSKIPDFLEELKARFPKLAKRYLKSDKLQDLLFEADYVHIKEPFSNMNTEGPTGGTIGVPVEEEFEDESDEDGDSCQFCDQSKLVKRRRRSIRVHHGLIASGNKVIKDGLLREKLNSAHGGEILCFETEAAGLMNNFPCLVIRGICDYCDSHKNNAWQKHAAAVAAAFAKELLGCIQPSDFEGERLIRDVMIEVKQDVQRLHDVSMATKRHLDVFRDDAEAKKQENTLHWLSPLNFPLIQHDLFARCAPDTGQEFLLSEQVQNWILTSQQTLFCEGVPGAGKTFQMAILVNYLIEKFRYDGSVGVAYVYYNFKRHHNQKAEHMLASLIKQLTQNSRTFPEAVQKLHDRHSLVNTRPFLVELSDTLSSLVQSFSRVFILIDALDEAEDTERTRLLDHIFAMQERSGINLFATSRAINTIASKFEGSISRAISPSHHDVFQVLNARMSELPSFVRQDERLQNEIKVSIEAAMGGMFLLAQLYLNSFVGSRSLASLKKSLDSLQQASSSSSSASSSDRSSVLDEAYDKSMERIQQMKGDLPRDAVLIISWIVKAKRQMKVAELREALAVEIGASELDRDNIPAVDHIIQACASLVVVEGDGIELVHYTAQEYFERPDNRWMQQAQTYITNVCLTYLAFPEFRNRLLNSWEDRATRIENCPFYGYADANWAYHTNQALAQGFEISRVIEVLEYCVAQASWFQNLVCGHLSHCSLEALTRCQDLYPSLTKDPKPFPTQVPLLHIAAFFGLHEVVAALLSQGFSPYAEDSDSNLPIYWAAFGGDARVVRLLPRVTNVAMTDEASYAKWEPLSMAALMGHEAAVEAFVDTYPIESWRDSAAPLAIAAIFERRFLFDLLVEKGVDIEVRDEELGQTILHWCAAEGRVAVIQWLVERGANIEAKDKRNDTPLVLAANNDHEDVVRYLVEKGANIEAMDDNHQTPLMLVIKGNNENLVRYLVDKGANMEAMNKNNHTPFTMALQKNLHHCIEIFTRNGIDLNGIMPNRYTPLTMAIEQRDDGIVGWLIENGADLDGIDGYDKTPLLTAIGKGHKHVVQLLIEKGSGLEFRVPGEYHSGPTPLVFAAGEGRKDIVDLLLDKGAEMEARSDYSDGTALGRASCRGHTDVIQLLLDRGANIEAKGVNSHTPLIQASISGHANAIKSLLINNANLEARSCFGYTALRLAVYTKHPDIVRILLDGGANVDTEDNEGFPAIARATKQGYATILTMLLESRARTDYKNDSGQTLMHIAVGENKFECVRILLARDGVEVDGKDNKGRTPISHAAECGYKSVLKALLESEKVDANMKDNQGYTPLRYAMNRQDDGATNILLSSTKVDVNAKDNQGRTPLLYAIESKQESNLKMLLGVENLNANEKDGQGRTPIQCAIDHTNEDEAILRTLLDSGKVDVNAKDSQGRTPLLYAIERKEGSIVRVLLECGKLDANLKEDQGRTSIQYAMNWEDEDRPILEALLSSGKVDVNAKDGQGQTPLHYAIASEDELLLRMLLDCEEVDANKEDDQGRTPLQYAMHHKGQEGSILRALLKSGKADVNAEDSLGQPPLFYAIQRKDDLAVDALLESNQVELNGWRALGGTPLFYAMFREGIKSWLDSVMMLDATSRARFIRPPCTWTYGCQREASIVRKLLGTGKFDLSMENDEKRTPLQYATQRKLGYSLEVLLEYASVEQVNAKDDQGRTPFQNAIELGEMSIIERFLHCFKVDVNARDDQERTPLRYAVEHREEAIVKALLDCADIDTRSDRIPGIGRGVLERIGKDAVVDANARDNQGRTPLLYAVQSVDEPAVQMLLQSKKVDANMGDDQGRTPLVWATELRIQSIVKALLNYPDIDPNSRDDEGRTPISLAIQNGAEDIMRLLLDSQKVNVNTADKEGRTPLSYAMELRDKYTVRTLLTYRGMSPDIKDGQGRTPLSYAASHEVARELLRTGKVDLNSKDNQGRTSLWYAMKAGNHELEGLLRRRGAKDRSETRSKPPSSQRLQGRGSRYRRTEG